VFGELSLFDLEIILRHQRVKQVIRDVHVLHRLSKSKLVVRIALSYLDSIDPRMIVQAIGVSGEYSNAVSVIEEFDYESTADVSRSSSY
jgi:hypothetical protein